MVLMTKHALDEPNSSIFKLQKDVSDLLKTTTDAFDSFSKALSLSTSSLLDGLANIKLDEAAPQSKGGDEEEAKKTPTKQTKPEVVIDLEKEPTPTAREPTPSTVEDPKGKT